MNIWRSHAGKGRGPAEGGLDTAKPSRRQVRFGRYAVDYDARQLTRDGIAIRLQEQPWQVLCALLEKPGDVISREELRRRLWPEGTFVEFEQSLNKAVNKLRRALQDSAGRPMYVETLARRGYRFVAPVEVQSPAEVGVLAQAAQRPARAMRWLAIVLLLVGILAAGAGRLLAPTENRGGAPRIRSIAVLPLADLSGNPGQEYFADGMTDKLITELAQISDWRVISRTSVLGYKGTRKPLPEIARDLGAEGIVEGTVVRSGGRVRITAQFIHAATDVHLWAGSFEREMSDVLALQREIARAIGAEIKAKLSSEQQVQAGGKRSVNP